MPFILLIVSEMLLVTGVQGTYTQLFDLLSNDFTGDHSFIYWLFAIAIIGGVGYVPGMKPISNAFLLLVLLILFLKTSGNSGGNLFQNISTSLASSTQGNLIPISDVTTSNSGSNSGSGANGSSGGGDQTLNDIGKAASIAAIFA